jgi:CxxC motif-containing protein (DUF1111 family)
MRHLRFFSAVLLATVLVLACEPAPPPSPEVTVNIGDPFPDLTEEQLSTFLLGKAVFSRLTSVEEGLGPTYNQTRCSDCHTLPVAGGSGPTDRTLGKVRKWENGECDLLEEFGGDLIQKEATPPLLALGYEPPEADPPDASIRIDEPALAVFGLGLVEQIPEADILALADPDDADGDGISGRPGYDISGHPGQEGKFGRFTRKSEWNRLYDFIEAALNTEIGLTSPRHLAEQTLNGEPVPPEADPMPDPEMDERGVQMLYDFVRFLAPPARAEITSAELQDSVARGEALFEEVQCAACHTPTMYTGENEIAVFSEKPVHLYSDLLLHDMGEELLGMCGPYALPTEYRTAWLWGLRYKANYMQAGQASTLTESIELHGGESAASRQLFRDLSDEDKAMLLRFLSIL